MNHSDVNSRTLVATGLVNSRDLGGLRRSDGTLTPSGVFFRSENVDWLTPEGWEEAYDVGIRTVVDLRQQRERDKDAQQRPEWLNTIHIDLDGLENQEFWADYWDNGLVGTAMYFLPHLEAMPERAAAALAAIANAPPGGVLFHCMGGRDRTGLISMMLLSAIDTEVEEIVDDYLETVRLADIRSAAGHRNYAEPVIEELCVQYGTTTEGAFRSAVAGFDSKSFMDVAGLPESDRLALKTWRGAL